MIYIPGWISNTLFFITCWMAGIQHMLLKRERTVINLQFMMMAFCLIMIWVIATNNTPKLPWLSFVFFILSAGCFGLIFRYFRRMPPRNPIE